jgi:hypothetical protein
MVLQQKQFLRAQHQPNPSKEELLAKLKNDLYLAEQEEKQMLRERQLLDDDEECDDEEEYEDEDEEEEDEDGEDQHREDCVGEDDSNGYQGTSSSKEDEAELLNGLVNGHQNGISPKKD